jgi:biotin carboxylase
MAIYTEEKAEKFLSKFVPVARSFLVRSEKEALAKAKAIKYPLVMKFISPKALHKTEIGGVKIVRDAADLKTAFKEFQATARRKKVPLAGVLLQEFVKGEEVIIGINKDPTFGHVIAFGIGGKYVEVIKDITFRACPITLKDAQSMIDDLKYKKILFGVRGAKPVNLALLKKTLVSVSQIPTKNKGIDELDINPFIINDKTGKVADARIITK